MTCRYLKSLLQFRTAVPTRKSLRLRPATYTILYLLLTATSHTLASPICINESCTEPLTITLSHPGVNMTFRPTGPSDVTAVFEWTGDPHRIQPQTDSWEERIDSMGTSSQQFSYVQVLTILGHRTDCDALGCKTYKFYQDPVEKQPQQPISNTRPPITILGDRAINDYVKAHVGNPTASAGLVNIAPTTYTAFLRNPNFVPSTTYRTAPPFTSSTKVPLCLTYMWRIMVGSGVKDNGETVYIYTQGQRTACSPSYQQPDPVCSGESVNISLGTVAPGPISGSGTVRVSCTRNAYTSLTFADGSHTSSIALPSGNMTVELPALGWCSPTCVGDIRLQGIATNTGSLTTSVPLLLTYF